MGLLEYEQIDGLVSAGGKVGLYVDKRWIYLWAGGRQAGEQFRDMSVSG